VGLSEFESVASIKGETSTSTVNQGFARRVLSHLGVDTPDTKTAIVARIHWNPSVLKSKCLKRP
jgi:hypothetical protein